METIYVYLFCKCYLEEHTSYTGSMLVNLNEEADSVVEENYRQDLEAFELVIKANPWAKDFLKYPELCDMLVTPERIITAGEENR